MHSTYSIKIIINGAARWCKTGGREEIAGMGDVLSDESK
jgi:hypothetical protein